jgi:3-oxoadipate enol-lactonase
MRGLNPGLRLLCAAAVSGSFLWACSSAVPPVVDSPAQAWPSPVANMPAPRWVDTAVGRIAVRELGRGEHTLVLWPSILADHGMYASQIEAWRNTYRLILIDGPGHGASGPAPGPFSMQACAQALAQVLDSRPDSSRRNDAVVVVGTSWGGLVAGEFAISYPARTRAAVLLNTPAFKPDEASFADHFVSWGARWINHTQLYSNGVARAFFQAATREAGGPVLAHFHAHIQNANGQAMQQAVHSVLIGRQALAPRMSQIKAPTLVLAGSFDGMYPIAALRQAAAQLPQGRFVEVPSAHIAAMDAPAATTAAIDSFLASLPLQ